MTTRIDTDHRTTRFPAPSGDPAFDRFAGAAALLTAGAGVGYAVAFVVLADPLLAGLFLAIGGLAASPAQVAVYLRLRGTAPGFAALAVLLTVTGVLGSAVHGGYDLANALHPPAGGVPDLPNAVDPRGLLTFGVAGIGLLTVACLITKTRAFPRGVGVLAALTGLLLLVLYVGRLVVLDPSSAVIAVPAVVTGFLVNPAFYIWLGVSLLRTPGR